VEKTGRGEVVFEMKETRPLVSVVVPCLNRAHFLIPTIESILQQDYPNIECIVVDGGSTDDTIEILKRYGERIKWVSEPDNGHADAINKGWQMSNGEILAWLNADDVWKVPDAVSQAVKYLQIHPEVDVVYGNCGSIDEKGKVVGMSYLHEWKLEYAVEYCDHCIPQPAAFVRREILETVGWLDTAFRQKQDHDLWLRIGLDGNIQHLPILVAHARNTRGLSIEKTAAPACIQVTRKFYSLPNVPPNLMRKKRRAFSNSYIRGMQYAFAGGNHWGIILRCAAKAAFTEPKNTVKVLRHLRGYLMTGAADDWRFYCVFIVLKLLSFPRQLFREVKRWWNKLKPPRIPNLLGDRDVEWSWVTSQMPSGSGEALDFGTGQSPLALIAAQRGFNVTAIDLEAVRRHYVHPKLYFIQGNILKLSLPENHFDLVINCSTVEHVGLAGRYGVTENLPDGDLEAMARLRELMKPDGVMLLTVPVGQDAVFTPMTKVYGFQRLPLLLEGFTVEIEEFWIKNAENRWIQCDRETALRFKAFAGSRDAMQNIYALGCFVLRRESAIK
jgi:glycosyltransferase involved in cell wall biosynthesis